MPFYANGLSHQHSLLLCCPQVDAVELAAQLGRRWFGRVLAVNEVRA